MGKRVIFQEKINKKGYVALGGGMPTTGLLLFALELFLFFEK
jgi:hypothetical protein